MVPVNAVVPASSVGQRPWTGNTELALVVEEFFAHVVLLRREFHAEGADATHLATEQDSPANARSDLNHRPQRRPVTFGFAKDDAVVDAERTRKDRVVAATLFGCLWISNHRPTTFVCRQGGWMYIT